MGRQHGGSCPHGTASLGNRLIGNSNFHMPVFGCGLASELDQVVSHSLPSPALAPVQTQPTWLCCRSSQGAYMLVLFQGLEGELPAPQGLSLPPWKME